MEKGGGGWGGRERHRQRDRDMEIQRQKQTIKETDRQWRAEEIRREVAVSRQARIQTK